MTWVRHLDIPTTVLGSLAVTAALLSVAMTPEIPWGSLPTEQEIAQDDAAAEQAELLKAQALMVATLGMDCWEPGTGPVPSRLAVQWVESGVVEVVPRYQNRPDAAPSASPT